MKSWLEKPGMREEMEQPMKTSVKDSVFKAGISGAVKSMLELCSSEFHTKARRRGDPFKPFSDCLFSFASLMDWRQCGTSEMLAGSHPPGMETKCATGLGMRPSTNSKALQSTLKSAVGFFLAYAHLKAGPSQHQFSITMFSVRLWTPTSATVKLLLLRIHSEQELSYLS